MALPLGKLTIIIGAGLVGSVLAKEGRMPGVGDLFSEFFSGASKVLKLIKHNDEKPSSSPKPRNDALLAQVNSLRQELQLLASNSNGSVTIVTSSRSATNKYGILVIVFVAGYGYVWWKGWKLSDMMFATKATLKDATNAVAKQFESFSSKLSGTERHLSSRIERLDCRVEEFNEQHVATQEDVKTMKGDVKTLNLDVKSVHETVYNLTSRLDKIEGGQYETKVGMYNLNRMASLLNNPSSAGRIEANPSSSSTPALPAPHRALSLPPVHIEEQQSSPLVSSAPKRPLRSSVSVSSSGFGLKDLQGTSETVESGNISKASNGFGLADDTSPTSRVFGRTYSGIGASFSRTRPASGQ